MSQVELPVARVYVELGLSHLDRPFDYEVPEELDTVALPGTRVRVKFSGRTLDGYVVARAATTDQQRLVPLAQGVSAEQVLPPESIRLIRAVADHYGGTFSDVARLAVPPRHATTEKAQVRLPPPWPEPDLDPGPLALYPTGREFLHALASGGSPRASWLVAPVSAPIGDWAEGVAAAVAATVASGRSAVVVVPDGHDVDRIQPLLVKRVGKARVARQTSDLGPSARYRSFLRGLRGQAQVVVGTRAAVFAPVHHLGLVCLWDDGDDNHAEPRAPYPHAREVAALRVTQSGAGLLVASHARTAEVESWRRRDWLRPIQLTPDLTRLEAPLVRAVGDDERSLARDPAARAARLPSDVFTTVRAALARGPVLVQVPRAGYLGALACRACREPARCPQCRGQLRSDGTTLSCSVCGHVVVGWACSTCGGTATRSAQIGSRRTAEELGRAFPGTVVRQSAQDARLDSVGPDPALVVATPGAEPPAESGYAAAVLLDASSLLGRLDLRAGEEALRRWLTVTALVRPAADGGTVLVVGPVAARSVQALVRLDPAGFAERELDDRIEAGFPPALRFARIQGDWPAVREMGEALRSVPGARTLGPVELPDAPMAPGDKGASPQAQVLVRAPLSSGAALTREIHAIQSARSARKDPRPVKIVVDPSDLA